MIKQILLLKRRPGMSMEDFKKYYENHHVKIVEKYMTPAKRYVRRYVKPQKNPMTGQVVELDFDVVTEIWWESKADMEAVGKKLAAANLYPVIHEDEKQLFASHDNRTFTVEECDSDLGELGAGN
jgi:hypothetical protein